MHPSRIFTANFTSLGTAILKQLLLSPQLTHHCPEKKLTPVVVFAYKLQTLPYYT